MVLLLDGFQVGAEFVQLLGGQITDAAGAEFGNLVLDNLRTLAAGNDRGQLLRFRFGVGLASDGSLLEVVDCNRDL